MISGEEFEAVVSSGDGMRTLQVLSDLKTQVKRFLVDLNDVPSYIIGLKNAYNQSHALEITSFTTLCHLITRISMQDPSRLGNFSNLIMPFLLERLADRRQPVAQTAKKSLKTFWLCVNSLDDGFLDIIYHQGFQSDNYKVQKDILDVLNSLLSNNVNFSFKSYIKATVELLSAFDTQVQQGAIDVLLVFFQRVNPNSRNAKLDLIDLLHESNTNEVIAVKLLETIGGIELVNEFRQNKLPLNDVNDNDISMINTSGMEDHFNSILVKIPFWELDQTISPIQFSLEVLNEMEVNILPVFNGKETELNWKSRQDWIVKMRSMVRSIINLDNSSYLQEIFGNFIKQIKDCIVKGLISLRTTLSNNACQLCKEIGIFLGQYVDFITFDVLTNTLMKLCAGRKTIQHQNSNAAMIGLMINCNITTKFIPLLSMTIQEKNIQPKIYIGQWIHLILIKYYNDSDSITFDKMMELIEPILLKGVSDSQSQVRESMRNAFWCLNELSPEFANKLKDKLDINTLRALDKSKINSKPKRSIKEFINEKKRQTQKEMFEKENFAPFIKETLIDRDITKRSISLGIEKPTTISNKIQVQQRSQSLSKPKDEYEDFTERLKRQNLIFDEITSNFFEDQERGILNLLKLNNNDKEINYKLHSAINNLTYVNPLIFWKIFENTKWIKKMDNYLSSENLLRVYCVHFYEGENPTREEIDLILENLKIEDICLSIDSILRNCKDTFKIDDLKLSIQYNKYKSTILKITLIILRDLFIFKSNQLKAYILSSIFEILNECLPIIEESLKPIYFEILDFSYKNWHDEYIRSLKKSNEFNNEIYEMLNIQREEEEEEDLSKVKESDLSIDNSNYEEEYDEGNLEHMTKLIPKADEIRRMMKENGQACDDDVEDFTKVIPRNGWSEPSGGAGAGVGVGDIEIENDEFKQVFESIEEEEEESIIKEDNEPIVEMEEVEKEEEEEDQSQPLKLEEPFESPSVEIIEYTDIQHPSELQEEEEGEVPSTDSTPDIQTLDINQSDTIIEDGFKYELINNWKEEIEINERLYIDLIGLSKEELIEQLEGNFNECSILSILESYGFEDDEEILKLIEIKKDWSDMAYFFLQEVIRKNINKISIIVKKVKIENYVYFGLVLDRLDELIEEGNINGEDVFLLNRLISRGVKDENSLIRMKSFKIYSKLYKIFCEGSIDESNGYPIVDEMIFKDINKKILEMMLL